MEYYIPFTLDQAEKLKNKPGKNAYFAGGTILNWKGKPRADALISLEKLGLNRISATNTKISIGAMATIRDIADSNILPEILTDFANRFTSVNIRNMATAGGSAAGVFFVSHLLPVFTAYRAKIEYFSSGKKRKTLLTDWLKNRKGVICSIIINDLKRKVFAKEEKIAASDLPIIVTSTGIKISSGRITSPVISISGAAGRLVISGSGAKYLSGRKPADVDFLKLNTAVQKDIKPVFNIKAPEQIKRKFIESHLKKLSEKIRNLK